MFTPVWADFMSAVIIVQLIRDNPDTTTFDLNLGLFLPYHGASESNVFVQDSKTHTFQDVFIISFALLHSLLHNL